MTVHEAHRVPISSYGGTAGATLLWRRGGQLRVTIILKVQLALIPDDLAIIAPGAEIHHVDTPHDTAAARALDIPSDLVPAGGSEVLLSGHACAPTGRMVSSLSVRLFLGRDELSVLDKTVHVYGDRAKTNAVPQPFSRIPLVYQRAVGGPNTDNPVGRPLNDASHPPNVVNPLDPWVVAGFGPIASSWPMRQRLSRTPPLSKSGILEVPDDLPLEYFSVAPRDQRIPAIAGDEWIIVDGMHPELGRFQSQLPNLLARARLSRRDDKGTPGVEVGLSIARLAIDMDRVRAELTWRGSVALDPADIPFVHVIGGIEQQSGPMEEPPQESMTETMMLNEDQIRDALHGRELPWRPAASGAREATSAPRAAKVAKGMAGLPFGDASRNAPTFGPPPPGILHAAPEIREISAIPSFPTPTPSQELFQNDVTITSIDDSILNVLPFGKGSPRASSFDVPRMTDDESDDIGGQTAVTPVMHPAPRNALPFMPSGQRAATRASASRAVPPGPAAPAPPAPQRSGLPFSTSGPSAVPLEPLFGSSVEPPAHADASALPSLSTAIDMPVVTDLPAPPESPDTQDGPATLSVAPPEQAVEPEVAAPPAEPEPAEPQAEAVETGIRKTVLDNVRAGTAMHGMDLASADLSNLDLTGAILADAKLSGARLSNTILRNARLSGAKLMGADLRGADLTEANLARADLTRAILTDAIVTKADLSDANASLVQAGNTKLDDLKADRASFVQAHLERAVLDRASLRDCDFSGAFVAHASFREVAASSARFAETRGENAVFDAARLDGAIFTGANLEDASFTGVQAARSNWERAVLDRAVFDRATITDATFARASLEVASFLSSNLTKTDLSNISADGADFSESKLTGCDLRMSKLSDARLEKANLREVNAQKTVANGARFEGADLQKASLRGARLKGSDLANTQLDGADLRDADLENAKLDGVDVSKAKLGGANLKGAVGL